MPDIETREDIERLVRVFYTEAMADPMIGFIFTDIAELDLEAHVPEIASFWETVLLGNRTYFGSSFNKHVPLHERVGLKHGQFERWLVLWFGAVDNLFAGERANQAKIHALRVAHAFHQRLQGFPSPSDAPSPDGLVVTRHGP